MVTDDDMRDVVRVLDTLVRLVGHEAIHKYDDGVSIRKLGQLRKKFATKGVSPQRSGGLLRKDGLETEARKVESLNQYGWPI